MLGAGIGHFPGGSKVRVFVVWGVWVAWVAAVAEPAAQAAAGRSHSVRQSHHVVDNLSCWQGPAHGFPFHLHHYLTIVNSGTAQESYYSQPIYSTQFVNVPRKDCVGYASRILWCRGARMETFSTAQILDTIFQVIEGLSGRVRPIMFIIFQVSSE